MSTYAMRQRGQLVGIYIAANATQPMQEVKQAEAVAGRGLEGDRYFNKTGTFSRPDPYPDGEVTLIEIEAIDAVRAERDLEIEAIAMRRNLVTRGVSLNDLVGCDFRVGAVSLRGIRLCEPCEHLARLTRDEVLPAFIHRGGLRAQITGDGVVRAGDVIECDVFELNATPMCFPAA